MEDAVQLDLVEYIIAVVGGLDQPAWPDRMSGSDRCVHFEHTPPVHPIAEAGSCVQNEPLPSCGAWIGRVIWLG